MEGRDNEGGGTILFDLPTPAVGRVQDHLGVARGVSDHRSAPFLRSTGILVYTSDGLYS
jgi:hypothetical protein